MKKFICICTALCISLFAIAQSNDSGLPEYPDPNKCYVKCVTPDVYKTVDKEVIIKPAYKKIEISPAEYKYVEETVVVKEACTEYKVIPAEYELVKVDYKSIEGYNKLAVIPASFQPSEIKVEVFPAISRWEYAAYDGCKSEDPLDCQVLCWRSYDPQYKIIPGFEMTGQTTINKKHIEATKATYMKKVVTKPAQVVEVKVPAETTIIKKKVLVKDETTIEVEVPAEVAIVKKEVLVKKGGITIWEEVECELLNYSLLPVNYSYGSAILTSNSKEIIDKKLVAMMKEKPNVKVEISSHTDSRGSADANLQLSEQRAQAVANYLMSRGINASRLVAKGFGETRLKNRCSDGLSCTEQEHAVNRRTEFRVLNF